MRVRGLCKLPDGKDWLWRQLSLALVGRPMLSKSLIQFYTEGWGTDISLDSCSELDATPGPRNIMVNERALVFPTAGHSGVNSMVWKRTEKVKQLGGR